MPGTTRQDPPNPPAGSPSKASGASPPSKGPGRRSPRWLAIGLPALVAVALVAGILAAVLGRNGTGGTGAPLAPTPTGPPTAPTTTAPPHLTGITQAVYPTATSSLRFDHPVAAARSFAADFVGFVDPIIGSFSSTGTSIGTVPVRAASSGPVTTVHLQRVTGTWWVLGAAADYIEVHVPTPSASVMSPTRLEGTSTAFEATVGVEVRQDGQRAPIGTGSVMGGSMGEMAPFAGSAFFSQPTAKARAVVFSTISMVDGHIWEASVVRVRFAPVITLSPATDCPDYSMARPTPPAGEMVVTVFYSCGVDATPVATYRLRPASTGVLRTALEQLLAGPTSAETAAGLTSWFSAQTATLLAGVTLVSGTATVDFHDLRPVIPNASSSTGSHMLLAQLDATVFQFRAVQAVTYRIDGSCETFSEWLQFGGCVTRTRPGG